MCRWSLPLGFAALVGFALSVPGQDAGKQDAGKKEIKVGKTWSGKLLGQDKEAVRKLAPSSGYVGGPKAFTKLWKAWRTEEKVPDVDFARKLVLVGTVGGPNDIKLVPYLDPQGNLTTGGQSTLVSGPGFSYTLIEVDRDGIKTVQGKALAKDE